MKKAMGLYPAPLVAEETMITSTTVPEMYATATSTLRLIVKVAILIYQSVCLIHAIIHSCVC